MNKQLMKAISDALVDMNTLLNNQPVDGDNNVAVDGESAHKLDMMINSLACRSPNHSEVWMTADCELFIRCRTDTSINSMTWYDMKRDCLNDHNNMMYFKAVNIQTFYKELYSE